ncbi:MAG: hypothetical protein K5683_03395 [Prevotella sp.]|nr:hypothetical protein [Prevotella sp.]
MYAKKLFKCMLMATLTIWLGTNIVSCKDYDDDDNNSEQRNDDANPLDNDQAETAWRWLSTLTNAETLTSDWASRTYEPAIGQVSEQNANTRIIVVSDIDEARQNFASMAGIDIAELSSEKTVSQSGVGKLVWIPSKENAENLAEVSVDIKIIPTLQKIVYCTEDQIGQNGLFNSVKGTAYYRLGDVVRDKQGYFWVCVRPSFEQNNKEESHWINIINCSEEVTTTTFPAENLYDKYNNSRKYNGNTILLPTQLKYSREHMNNLANLVWALLDPQAYAMKVGTQGTKNGLCGFDYKYHGMKFLNNVAEYWSEIQPNSLNHSDIWQLLFNRSRAEMEKMTQMTLIYKGYQWRIGSTGYVWEFTTSKQENFQKKAKGSESGDKTLYDFGNNGYDITAYCSAPTANTQIAEAPKQFGTDGHYYWVVRYKKGSELNAQGDFSPYTYLGNVTNIYNYNKKTGRDTETKLETENDIKEITTAPLDTPEPGCLLCSDGKFYSNIRSAQKFNATPMAIVVHYGEPGSVETGTQYRGLAISTSWVKTDIDYVAKWGMYSNCSVEKVSLTDIKSQLNGIANTDLLVNGCGQGHVHDAATYCRNYNPQGNQILKQMNCSKWFLGSAGQWIIALETIMKVEWNEFTLDFNYPSKDNMSGFFRNAGYDGNILLYSDEETTIWTSTPTNNLEKVYGMSIGKTGNCHIRQQEESYNLIRPMIAF